MRSNVPDARSRCMVIDVITNITNNGNTTEQDQAGVVECRRRAWPGRNVLEHEVHQRDDQARHHQNHRDAASVSGELTQDPRCAGAVGPQSYPAWRSVLRLMIDRNASSSELHPVSSRSWVRCGVGDQLPVAHEQQIAAVIGLVHHMAGHHQRGAGAGQRVELQPEVSPQHGIQADRGFVEDQQVGLADERAGQRDPGSLSAGQVAAVRGAVILQSDGIDRGVGGTRVHAVQRREVAHVVDDPKVVVDRRILRHVSDASAQLGRAGRLTEDGDGPGRDDLGADDRSASTSFSRIRTDPEGR